MPFVGIAWLGQLSADTPYLTGVAPPMALLGIGHGASLGPLTASGLRGARPVSHQNSSTHPETPNRSRHEGSNLPR